MAEIKTTGLTGGDLTTTAQPGEQIRDWVQRHEDAYKPLSPDGNTLTTTWPKGGSITTTQESGESASQHHTRHWEAVTAEMQNNPPDPS